MNNKQNLSGPRGEEAAAQYLKEHGYKILECNYRVSGSEVDIIALKDDSVCFVEVKTRESDDCGLPEEFVNYYKRRKIIRAAKIYMADQNYEDFFTRFDIISVMAKPVGTEINHITHAFDGNDG